MVEMPVSSEGYEFDERWADIKDFPGYSVSDWGRVMNTNTKTPITPTKNSRGHVIVGLMQDRKQVKRSLPLLVATAFLPPHPYPNFNTVINLDGDRTNNHASNLMWRPLWFARKYMQQFTDNHGIFVDEPIEDVETHITYDNSMAAAMRHGLLDQEIFISMVTNGYVLPTRQIFRRVA